jgi:methylenetetrahydrofolate dehydrogenase (NADP+)/methenyltetrahydrofolate cyclohydrolase
MSAQILDGKALAAKLKDKLILEISELETSNGRVPCLLAVSFMKDPAIDSYRASQEKTAASLGINYVFNEYTQAHNEDEVVIYLKSMLADSKYDALFIFKPLPDHIDFRKVQERIVNLKNVEGIYPFNLGNLLLDEFCFVPPTPAAALELLKSSGVEIKGKHAVVIGRSEIVGKPMALMLLKENATVSICHSKTENLPQFVAQADIVIAAVGKPLFVKGDWIKPGAIVIDVGINQLDGKIVGDVDLNSCKDKASYISPVPGGVGPVTSVMLMNNVVEAFKRMKK